SSCGRTLSHLTCISNLLLNRVRSHRLSLQGGVKLLTESSQHGLFLQTDTVLNQPVGLKFQQLFHSLCDLESRDMSRNRRVLACCRVKELDQVLYGLSLLRKVPGTYRVQRTISTQVVGSNRTEHFCTELVHVPDGINVHVGTCPLQHVVEDTLKELFLKLVDLALEDSGGTILKYLNLERGLFSRSTEAHSLLRCACHLFHFLLKDSNLHVRIARSTIRVHHLHVTLFTAVNLFHRTVVEVINIAYDLEHRKRNQVECVSLQV